VPVVFGGVYKPVESTAPPAAPSVTAHVTARSAYPETEARNRCDTPGATEIEGGEIVTEIAAANDARAD